MKNKGISVYWVLFLVLLDRRQRRIVLKSSLFSIIWQFVGLGVTIFVRGVCGGDGMWGWWYSVWMWPSSSGGGGWVGNYGNWNIVDFTLREKICFFRSGFRSCAEMISVCHVCWQDVLRWCMIVPRLCQYTTRTIHLDVCSNLCYVILCMDYSYAVIHIFTKAVSMGVYILNIGTMIYLRLFVWRCNNYTFKKDSYMAACMHGAITVLNMNAGGRSSFF